MKKNPFYPNYGIEPSIFVGREKILSDFLYGLENGPGDPNRSTVLTGPRGTGKTVILRKMQKAALEYGWISIYCVQSPRLLDEILNSLEKQGQEFIEPTGKSRITGVSLGKLGITREFVKQDALPFEAQFEKIVNALTQADIGLVVEIDEVRGNSEPLRRFSTLLQTMKADGMKLALVMAGLPHELDRVFKDKVISFLRRSRVKEVALLDYSEVYSLFKRTFAITGHEVDEEACALLTEKSGGFPYLVQLLGYEVWEKTRGNHVTIDVAKEGIKEAEVYIGSSMIELILQDLSELDITFLQAMSADDGESKMSDIVRRLGMDANKASQYRLRLLREAVIKSPKRGVVDFSIPYMRDYLRVR